MDELKDEGKPKTKIWSLIITAIKYLNNNVDLNKTFDTVFGREVIKAARAEAQKLGASPEELKKYDEIIAINDKLLKDYTRESPAT